MKKIYLSPFEMRSCQQTALCQVKWSEARNSLLFRVEERFTWRKDGSWKFAFWKVRGIILAILVCLSLQGCMPFNGRTIGTSYTDSNITYQIHSWLMDDPNLKNNTHIVVATNHGNVLLAGQVPYPRQRIVAEKLAKKVKNVKRIYNEITIAGPTSALTRSSDSWITTKVKSELLVTKGIPSNQIQVITENGTVFLMGNVNSQQGKIAANVASSVIGVQKVVKLFGQTRG